MKIEPAPIEGAFIIIPEVHEDDRGFFFESYRHDVMLEHGLDLNFVQDNHSRSAANVIRGLHFQWDPPMAKLMRVTAGRAFLMAVDIRKGSPTLGEWFGMEASAENKIAVYAPAGFARGFASLVDGTEIQYKCTGTYNSSTEGGIAWDDPAIGIKWPLDNPSLSDKDRNAVTLEDWLARPESENFRWK
jgi:dTDP-4-dehydrorhamnose 3,5-epimerase